MGTPAGSCDTAHIPVPRQLHLVLPLLLPRMPWSRRGWRSVANRPFVIVECLDVAPDNDGRPSVAGPSVNPSSCALIVSVSAQKAPARRVGEKKPLRDGDRSPVSLSPTPALMRSVYRRSRTAALAAQSLPIPRELRICRAPTCRPAFPIASGRSVLQPVHVENSNIDLAFATVGGANFAVLPMVPRSGAGCVPFRWSIARSFSATRGMLGGVPATVLSSRSRSRVDGSARESQTSGSLPFQYRVRIPPSPHPRRAAAHIAPGRRAASRLLVPRRRNIRMCLCSLQTQGRMSVDPKAAISPERHGLVVADFLCLEMLRGPSESSAVPHPVSIIKVNFPFLAPSEDV